jgi:hypothetical protein
MVFLSLVALLDGYFFHQADASHTDLTKIKIQDHLYSNPFLLLLHTERSSIHVIIGPLQLTGFIYLLKSE